MKETIYSSESQMKRPWFLLVTMIHDLWLSRELAWQLLLRDIKARYRQSFLGYLWAFIPPLASAVPFILLNKSGVIEAGQLDIPYPAYAMIGTTLWQLFADSVNAPLKAVGAAKSMLVKINFPREAIFLAGYGSVLFDFAIRLLIIAGVFIFFQLPVSWDLLLFPFGLFSMMILGSMVGMLLVPLGVLFNDVAKALSMLLGIWMLLTPVVYAPSRDGFMALLADWNPVSPLIIQTRAWLVGGLTVDAGSFPIVFWGSLLLLLIGWFLVRLALPDLIARLGN